MSHHHATEQTFGGSHPTATRALTVAFALLVSVMPIWHALANVRAGRTPWADLLRELPTGESLKRFEQTLVDDAPAAQVARGPVQWWSTRLLARGNAKTVVGRHGWLYYRPSVDFTIGPAISAGGGEGSPLDAIVAYRDGLAQRGARLVVLPVPGKESIRPEYLAPGYEPRQGPPMNAGLPALLAELERRGVTVIDATRLLWDARGLEALFLPHDTHWTPTGMALVADHVARLLDQRGWLGDVPPAPPAMGPAVTVSNRGDLYDMLDLPAARPLWPATELTQRPLVQPASPARVLLLGDSFTNIYSDPALRWGRGAGLADRLALALGRRVDALAQNNGGANGVRQTLARQPHRLDGVRVVVWQFAVRSLALAEGPWRRIPVPTRRTP